MVSERPFCDSVCLSGASSFVHAVFPVDVLDVRVHAADAFAGADGNLDEAIVTPASTPRVLGLPVVVFALSILKASASCALTIAPPFGHGALLSLRCGCISSSLWLSSRLFWLGGLRRFCAFCGLTNDDECVIQLGTAAAVLIEDTRFVELEGLGAGIHSDTHWLLLQLFLGVADRGCDLAPLGDLADSFARIVLASLGRA